MVLKENVMKTKATVKIKIASNQQLISLLEALKPEIKKSGNRSKVEIDREGSKIILRVESKDTIALRATLNTYLRWINSSIDTLEVLKSKNHLNHSLNQEFCY